MKNIIINNSDRFKSVFVGVNLLLPLTGEENSKNALLAMVLKKSCSKFESQKDLDRTLAGLYDTNLDMSVEKLDNLYNIQCNMELLNIEYMGKENVDKACEILYSTLLSPNIHDGKFEQTIFDREKETLIEKIKEERDDKKRYALKELEKDMFNGTVYEISSLGTIEDLQNISNKDLVKHYYSILERAEIVVSACGNLNGMQDIFEKIYNKLTGECGKHVVENKQEVNTIGEIVYREEVQDIAQSVLTIGLKVEDAKKEDVYALLVYNSLLGGTPASKLFQNVREKESLAYFAKSMYNRYKSAIYMYAGVDPNKAKKAQEVMLKQLQLIQNRQVTDEEFDAAKQYIISSYNELQDSKMSTAKTMLNNEIFFEKTVEIEEMIKAIENITKEDIFEVAQKVKATNIFLLGGVSNG